MNLLDRVSRRRCSNSLCTNSRSRRLPELYLSKSTNSTCLAALQSPTTRFFSIDRHARHAQQIGGILSPDQCTQWAQFSQQHRAGNMEMHVSNVKNVRVRCSYPLLPLVRIYRSSMQEHFQKRNLVVGPQMPSQQVVKWMQIGFQQQQQRRANFLEQTQMGHTVAYPPTPE